MILKAFNSYLDIIFSVLFGHKPICRFAFDRVLCFPTGQSFFHAFMDGFVNVWINEMSFIPRFFLIWLFNAIFKNHFNLWRKDSFKLLWLIFIDTPLSRIPFLFINRHIMRHIYVIMKSALFLLFLNNFLYYFLLYNFLFLRFLFLNVLDFNILRFVLWQVFFSTIDMG